MMTQTNMMDYYIGKKIFFCGINKLKDLKISYDELVITSPSATGDQMRRIVEACKNTWGRDTKLFPD